MSALWIHIIFLFEITFCLWFISWWQYVSEKLNHWALCNVCAPTILLTRRACYCWFGVLFCLTAGKRDKDDSPVQRGRFLSKARKKQNKKNRLLKAGCPRWSQDSKPCTRNVIFLGHPMWNLTTEASELVFQENWKGKGLWVSKSRKRKEVS